MPTALISHLLSWRRLPLTIGGHTYVSFLIDEGVHVKAIQAQAGHGSAAVALDRYGHLMDDSGERVKAALSTTYAAGQQPATVTPLRATG